MKLLILLVLFVTSCSLSTAENQLAADTTTIGGLQWFTNYGAGYRKAQEGNQYLLIYFKGTSGGPQQQAFEQSSLNDDAVRGALREIVLVQLPMDYQMEISGTPQVLIKTPAFDGMQETPGYLLIDLKNRNLPWYTTVVGFYPFIERTSSQLPGLGDLKPVEPWTAKLMTTILANTKVSLHDNVRALALHQDLSGTYLDRVPNPKNLTLSYREWRVIQLTNSERGQRDIRPLVVSLNFVEGCRQWSKHMADTRNLQHAPGNFAENIAFNQQSPEEVMNSWMNSSGHRANILSTRYDTMGAGDHDAGQGPYWCQRFMF